MWNLETRDNFRVVFCGQCKPDWFRVAGRAPTKAHTWAARHAKAFPGHEVAVIDLIQLAPEHVYRFEPLPEVGDLPPF